MNVHRWLLAACVSAPLWALAHITLEYPVATAGQYYKATLRVGHGCGQSPTRQIVVDLPAGVRGARPMPKVGWKIDIAVGKLAQPYTSHGRSVTEDVTRVTWTARTPDDMLPNAYFDEFVLMAQLPQQAQTLYWPVQQVCETGRNDWTQIPAANQSPRDLPSPAPALELMPAAGAAHQH